LVRLIQKALIIKHFFMSTKFLALPIVIMATVFSSFASTTVSKEPDAKKEFSKQFAGAANVNWSVIKTDLLRVSFTWAGHRAEAYYNRNAELIGAIRGLFYEQLPLSVTRTVDTKFKNPVVLEAREISNEEGTSYVLVLERKEKKIKVRLNGQGTIIDEQKLTK
jgi:hypothetical protein